MLLLQHTQTFKSPLLQFNGDMQTILPSRFRKINFEPFSRVQIDTPDGDFLNIDLLEQQSDKVVIISHGYEGDASKHYVRSTAKYFFQNGWDIAALNSRSCGGEMNRQLRMYDHGEIGDIGVLYNCLMAKKQYKQIVLIGWSMGGNIVLKFAAVEKKPLITHVISVSAPLNIKDSLDILETPACRFYKNYFLKGLKSKLEIKAQMFPEALKASDIYSITDWQKQLSVFFCQVNGYKTMAHFHKEGSALNYLNDLEIPALLITAKNDPIIPDSCRPYSLAKKSKFIYLETPENGGHCGFIKREKSAFSYIEPRALEFINTH